MIEQAAAGLLPPAEVQRLAQAPMLSPAVIERTAKVAHRAQSELHGLDTATVMARLIDQTLSAQGVSTPVEVEDKASNFDPALVQVSADLQRLLKGLKHTGSARVLLYGAPGTGKTAFVHWLTRHLGRELVSRRVSDIVSPLVGETEKLLAGAFREAAQSRAVLFFDEIDSFLQDRGRARQSWEITQVNELLVQMESFAGIFIAATNLEQSLDQAAQRRFDVKLGFAPLAPERAWRHLLRCARRLGMARPGKILRSRLQTLALLTPGDFALAERRCRNMGESDPQALYQILAGECAAKPGAQQRTIGFMT